MNSFMSNGGRYPGYAQGLETAQIHDVRVDILIKGIAASREKGETLKMDFNLSKAPRIVCSDQPQGLGGPLDEELTPLLPGEG